ncbi:hypothetical protein V1478_012070 [Vespula squamosa]|uniref:Uncharacterized protein n=1 Tax=Vespula squamosa TaxID=30214 RepID=A0ABD2AC61_VESSQ
MHIKRCSILFGNIRKETCYSRQHNIGNGLIHQYTVKNPYPATYITFTKIFVIILIKRKSARKHIFHEYTWHDLRITNIKLNFVTFVKNKKQNKTKRWTSVHMKKTIDIQISEQFDLSMNIIKLHKCPFNIFLWIFDYRKLR